MIVMTCQDDHRIRGQLTGLTKSTTDEPNVTDEVILMDELKQMPPSLTKASRPFNAINNTSDGYNNSYANR